MIIYRCKQLVNMKSCKDMGVQKKHSQFSDTKYKWRTVIVVFVLLYICGCGGQELIGSAEADPYLLNKSLGLTELPGGVLAGGETVWTLEKSPYLLRDDLLIERTAELVLEPGVEVRFAPMIGITVRGKLIAVGEHQNQITFTSTEEPVKSAKAIPDIRLVDGPSILAGRVQLLHRGQWRSVCTNSRNWTIHDMETACRQLGFMGGSFYNWIDRQPGRHARLLYEEPKCKGTEYDLFQCDWNSRQLGSGVCDYHPDLAIQCLPHHDNNELTNSGRHWRGIRFENAVYERILTAVNTLYVPTSNSKLVHVKIRNAGLGRDNNATSALDVIGVPPVMEDLEITDSAFNAINVTLPNAPIIINNCTIQNNRGYGIYVNSSYGMTKIENCLIHDNGGDGIKYVVHELNIDERFDRSEVFDLCTLASTPSQTFPIQMSLEQSRYSNMERDCNQKFYTRQDHVLTLSFLKILTNRNNSAEVFVYDGLTANDKLLLSFSIRNHTRPQSVSSTRNRMYVRFHANTRTDIVGFLRLTSGVSKTYDLNVSDSIISDNNGRGVVVENLRSQVHIHRTSISNNNHVAGLQVLNGAGDVNVTESRISFNQGDGINITVTGGNRNISRSIISSNQGYGIAVWINNTIETEYIPINQTTAVEYSELFKNLEVGILHGNYCGDSWVNITGNWFNTSYDSTIDISTCWRYNMPSKILNLQIGHNRFYQNTKVPIKIQPALNVLGKIEYNYFEQGDYGAIVILNRIEGKYLEEFEILPSKFIIQHNHFYGNKGPFVANLGLSPYSDLQYIFFTRNFLRDNKIREAFEPLEGISSRLMPRSRVAATVVLSSSNIDVFRNIINNPEAQYEIGSHVEDQSKVLNCTYNWLGFGDEEKVYNRLFHRKDRYNLAKIVYMPYLLHSSNPGATQINYNSLFVPQFNVPGTFVVGGEVDGTEILRQGEYDVNKDINIRPGGKLVLQSGVTLKFPPAIGMMVAGRLDARGKRPNDITFTLKEEIVLTNDSVYETDTENYEPTTPGYIEPIVPIRLLGGRTQHEGRLQVRVNEKWGTVCNYRWTLTNAALVCHQLGLALNPVDWFLEPNEIPTAGMTEDIILSNVECTEFDNDITKCKAETIESFENSCTHENDVGIRCYETSWAGLRFSPISERADLQYVSIEKAGLLDYSSNIFKPALQIDFARHSLESVKIANNYHDGLGVIYSDLYGSDAINTVRNSEFSNNRGSGISFKQLGLKVYGSVIENNNIAGISHNPHITGQQQREIAGWFDLDANLNMDESNYRPIMLPEYETDITLVNGETRHILFTKHYGENIEKTYIIKCNPGYVLGLQLLNPIHNFSTESICIYDSQNINEASTKWCLDRDLTTFPTTSNSFGVVLTYKSGKIALGGVVLAVSSVVAPVQNLKNRIVKGAVPTLQVVNSKIRGNTKGIKALYYNRYLNEIGDHFLRKANESIKIFNCEISHNKEEAVYVNTPFWDIHDSNITEITLMFNNSLITDNGRGIYHFARDLRSSNNLYHYILQDNTIERNKNGGFDVSLPYVWQYNENFTHSVFMNNNTWRSNQNFALIIDGHFAEVNISKNIFTDNNCKIGLISIRGMEKKMKVDANLIERNNGQYMVQFHMDSQSEIMGLVFAVFVYNQVKNNRYMSLTMRGAVIKNIDPTYVIGFKGIQKIKVSRNIFGNNALQYTLLAGIKTAKINNLLDVTENWWGSAEEHFIKNQIFDFDDWNNHAVATYLPYLLEETFDSSLSVTFSHDNTMNVNELGGRLVEDLTIDGRLAPYTVKADITVMPDVTLTILPGVILEFEPNVGILVLGTLNAIGHSSLPILMRPIIPSGNVEINRIEKRDIGQYSPSHHKHRRQLESLQVQQSIRLCTGRNCSLNDNVDKKNEGFLEYYNRTTLQWVPMCDSRFTERNAQVVCRELGFDPINAFFAHDRRVEYHSNSLSRIWSWPEPLQCVGTEDRYEDCPIRLNGQLYGHRHECKWDSEFVFIHCGTRNLEETMEYWGGIRFANPEFEYSLYEHRIHDHHTHDTMKKVESVLENVQIVGAGILHNEKSPAVQSIVKNPRIQNVNITTCAYHGINLVSPTDSINMMSNSIHDVLGEGISAISLTGEGRESEESSFTPLKDLNLPYHLFSLIDICDSSKVITVEERVLLYYKYDNNPVNCVKIFKSMFSVKPFGFRLLQFNLFNHTVNYGKRDSLTLYDGDIYNITAPQIGYLENGSPDEKKLFRSDGHSMSVKLFANGASSVHGFIAEIVTLPISAIAFNRDVQHNITNSEFSNNRDGAISYNSVGEVNPLVSITRNEFIGNCLKLYGNFTSCQAAVRLDVQNTQTLVFRNNLVRKNVGGLSVRADSRGSATSLRGWIHNNLFYENHDLPCLKVEGRQSSPYQEVTIYRNYFTRNKAIYRDVIVLRQVVSNFTYNYVHDNTGMRILEVSGFHKVRLPIYQTTSHNGFYRNHALDRDGRATIVAGTAGQHYVDNIFFNPDNDYEMITVNRSIFVDYNPNIVSSLDLWRTRIDAKHNFWSYNESLAVAGRIRDQSDNPLLLEVDHRPYYMNNQTVLGGGKCPPGWDNVAGTCYMYVGAPMTYEEARLFCLSDNASMPYVSGNYAVLYDFIQKQNQWYHFGDRVWVNHIDYVTQCTSFAFSNIEITDCRQKNAFICEIDPKITIDPLSWRGDMLAVGFIGILVAAVLLVGAALICWYSKSKHRHLQRLERRNSIRQSLHSVRSIGSINGGFPDTVYRRKMAQMSSRSTDTLTKGSDYKKMLASSTSMESMEKSQFNSSIDDTQSYDIYEAHNPNPNVIQLKHSTFTKKPSPEYSVPQNNNKPFNLAYRNEGYRDNSGQVSGAPSMNTVMAEEIPIIHHPGGLQSPADDDTLSPTSDSQYFNSDTLPLRDFDKSDDTLALKRDLEREGKIYGPYGAPSHGRQPKLSFLMELRSKMPEPLPTASAPQTTFGQRRNIVDQQQYYEENLPSPPHPPIYSNTYDTSPSDNIPSYDSSPRDLSREFDTSSPTPGILKSKSKSEALLETNFDFDDTESESLPITEASRSHSQPLETAM